MANYKGNAKALQPYRFKASGKPKKSQINLKLDTETKEKLSAIPNWPDKLRDAINKLIEAEAENQSQAQSQSA